jgi:hypothetical protein
MADQDAFASGNSGLPVPDRPRRVLASGNQCDGPNANGNPNIALNWRRQANDGGSTVADSDGTDGA